MPDFTTVATHSVPSLNQARVQWSGLPGAATGLAISQLGCQQSAPLLVICRSSRQAQRLEEEIRFFLTANHPDPDSRVALFPDWECLPYDVFSPHPDIISRRLGLLRALDLQPPGIVLTSVANLMQRLPPPDYLQGHAFSLQTGQQLDVHKLREQLQQASYAAVSQVLACGEYAIRGGLFDIFPIGSQQPFRLDLFDDLIESIHFFDPETQRSGAQTKLINMLPAREFPMTESAIRYFRQQFRKRFTGNPNASEIYRGVSKGRVPVGVDALFPLFFEATATLFDYLPESSILVLDDDVSDAAHHFQAETNDRYLAIKDDQERPALPPEDLYLSAVEVQNYCQHYRQIWLDHTHTISSKNGICCFPYSPPPQLPVDHKQPKPYHALTAFIEQFDGRIALVAETAGRREALLGILGLAGLQAKEFTSYNAFTEDQGCRLGILVGLLDRGLIFNGQPSIALITESQLYGNQVQQRRRRAQSSADPNAVIRSLAELNPGDPVVHVDHGVGRYQGLEHLTINGNSQEFLIILYRDEDKLYVPILSLQQVTRYIGGSSETAPLHKLGADAWSRAKKRADKRARDVAAELLAVEALRKSRKGQACTLDEVSYLGFCSGFNFEETPDQALAIGSVIKDLIAPKAMDRLVCGDVGFGKTEVALRAAFVVVESGHQVAILVPTTLLAQQHYQNFIDRFADQAVSIELLSRFRSRHDVNDVLERLRTGCLDIVIGTHRLLQNDISFHDLGLLILDEEQRFGVRQKEKLKKLRAEVDILTLTATPIPRTLHMAMSGLREISIISTPPLHRLSIKTFVKEWSNQMIREACQRELRRGGQVYFLHNEVSTINAMAERLHEILPDLEIAIAHGQLPERQLEHIMREFYHRRFHILLCTTIIENGIDIPNANTIIINRANRFGLSQLHQLRGRVGRSHHQAYAYLLIQDHHGLTANARKRLEALETMEALGAGFALASHDLEIRGAGELLGDQQSGSIDEVGFSLYSDYLNRAISSLRTQGNSRLMTDPDEDPDIRIELGLPALFPDSYLPDIHTRLVMYQRIATATSKEALYELEVESVDRFGLLPDAAKNLFNFAALKLLAKPLGLKKIHLDNQGGQLVFAQHANIDPMLLIQLIQHHPRQYRLEQAGNSLKLLQGCADSNLRFTRLHEVLSRLQDSVTVSK